MIGVANSLAQPTCRVTMSSTAERTADDVLAVKDALETAKSAADVASLAQLDLTQLRIRQTEAQLKLPDDEFATQVAAASARVQEAEAELATKVDAVRAMLKDKPGIVIARWTAARSHGGGATLGSMFSANQQRSQVTSGFVVLANIRASMLVFGEDFRTFVTAMTDADLRAFNLMGLSSYVMSAEHSAFTSSFNLSEALAYGIDVKLSDLGSAAKVIASLDRLKIAGHFASVAALESTGMIGPVEWKIEPTPVCRYVRLDATANAEELAELNRIETPRTDIGDKRVWCLVKNEPMDGLADFKGQVIYAVPAMAPRIYSRWHDGESVAVHQIGHRWYALVDLEIRSELVGGSEAWPFDQTPLRSNAASQNATNTSLATP
jgi:hypothetical protein